MSKRHAAAEEFVGRAGELRHLDAALTTSANGRGVLMVVSGEPGIGKTRFCDEVASMAQRRGFTVVNGRCWVDGGAPAFWPWQPVLRELCGDAAAGVLSAEPGRPAVDANRFVRFQAVTDLLAEACARSPVCLVIDDVHAADPAMLLVARFIARSLPGLALTLVLTRRSGEVVNDPDGGRLLAELEADAVPMLLEPFDLAETTDFLAVNGLAGLDVSLKSAVHRMAGGNPLSLRRVAALGTRGPDADSLPAGIRTAIDTALARLGPDAPTSRSPAPPARGCGDPGTSHTATGCIHRGAVISASRRPGASRPSSRRSPTSRHRPPIHRSAIGRLAAVAARYGVEFLGPPRSRT